MDAEDLREIVQHLQENGHIPMFEQVPLVRLGQLPLPLQYEIIQWANDKFPQIFSWDNEDNECMPEVARYLERLNIYFCVFTDETRN